MKKTVSVIGVPSDLGANMRGANMGPAAIRIAGLHDKIKKLGFAIDDKGDLEVPVRETIGAPSENFLNQITKTCESLSQIVKTSLGANQLPIVLGGDHSLAIGSISGVADHYKEKNESVGIIWIDAHADINTPSSSPSGNIHGMPLGCILGTGHPELVNLLGYSPKIDPKNVALIGIRDIDGEEKELCKKSGIRYYTMREIDERNMSTVMEEAIKLVSNGTSAIHLSLDLDGVDPLYAPGVSTPVTGGVSYRETHLALEMLADTNMLSSMDIVELNPSVDIGHKTAGLAVELITSALGKSIV